jgi:hypothetical protein
VGKYPDQLALPGLVWTRGQVAQLVTRWFGIELSLVTIGKYLRSWGLSPQKPVRKAYEQNPEAVTHWLEETYPAITTQARRDGGVVLWLDQTGLRSDNALGQCGRRDLGTGRPDPGGGKTGVRFGANAMAAINPVEHLNADTKRHVAQTNPANKHELAAEARTHLRRRARTSRTGCAPSSARKKSATPPSNTTSLPLRINK